MFHTLRIVLASLVALAVLQYLPPAAIAADLGVVNLYTSRHYNVDNELYALFTSLTGIRVNVVQGTPDGMLARLQAEGVNSPADVFMANDAGRLYLAKEAGLLQPVLSDYLDGRVPAEIRDPEGHWFGLTLRARVIAYAKLRVDPAAISTYESLADPIWRGRLLVRSSTHAYNLALIGSLINALGEEATEQWARGIASNLARPPQGGDTDQIVAVAAGQGDIAIVNSYYLARLMSSSNANDRRVAEQIGVVFPNQLDRGAHVNLSGAGMTAGAPNRQNALLFLEFLASDGAQRVFADGNNEYPVVSTVSLSPALETLGLFRAEPVSATIYGGNAQRALIIAQRAGWQ